MSLDAFLKTHAIVEREQVEDSAAAGVATALPPLSPLNTQLLIDPKRVGKGGNKREAKGSAESEAGQGGKGQKHVKLKAQKSLIKPAASKAGRRRGRADAITAGTGATSQVGVQRCASPDIFTRVF